MSHRYAAVAWNRDKIVYDAVLATGIAVSVGGYLGYTIATAAHPPDPMTLLIRALGTTAVLLLHVVLVIGPLARLSDLFAPLLYNRRHLGVATFLVALAHGALATLYYGAFGANLNPLTQLLFAGREFSSLGAFPFELLGFAALLWLFLMAATSHDYWLNVLSPRVWKLMHMGVYIVYALVIGHVALGSIQQDDTLLRVITLCVGVGAVGLLHAGAGIHELVRDSAGARADDDGDGDGDAWVRACDAGDIPESEARVVCLSGGERVAIFRHNGKFSAVTNVCAHQLGPLGEGRIIDGCITCPWHGYQYRPEDGRSPPPFTEQIATYRLRVEGRDVLVHPVALPPGTPVDPVEAPSIDPHAEPAKIPDGEPLFEDTGVTRVSGDEEGAPR